MQCHSTSTSNAIHPAIQLNYLITVTASNFTTNSHMQLMVLTLKNVIFNSIINSLLLNHIFNKFLEQAKLLN